MRTILLNFKWMWLFSVFFKRDITKCYNRAVEVILVLVSLSMGCSSVFIAFWVSIWQPYIHMWFVWHSTALYLFLNSGYCFFLIYYFYFGKRPVFLFICSFLKVFILGFSIKLIDNVVLVSGVQQSGSVIHCQLRIGTCHLPLQGLNHTLLSLLIFNALQKEFGVESRNEALCAQGGKTGRTGLQIVIFRSWFYEPNSCISSYLERHWNPSWGWLFLMSGRKLQATNRNLLDKYVLDCM